MGKRNKNKFNLCNCPRVLENEITREKKIKVHLVCGGIINGK